MEILLVSNDVQALVEVVSLFAVVRRREIACSVERGSVRTQYYAGRKIVRGKIDYHRAFAFDEKTFVFEFLNDGRHLVVIETFARIRVERNVQKFVDLSYFRERYALEIIKEFNAFLISRLDEPKIFPSRVVHRRIQLRFLVIFNVKAGDLFQPDLVDDRPIAPLFVCVNEFSELRSVVPEVVDADGVVAEKFIYAVQRRAYDGRRKMPDMKGLCDVYRGVVYADGLASAYIGRAESGTFFEYTGKNVGGERGFIKAEVEISVDRIDA